MRDERKRSIKLEGRARIYRQIRRELKQNECPFYRQIFSSPLPWILRRSPILCLGFYRLSFPYTSASAIGTDRNRKKRPKKRTEFIYKRYLRENDKMESLRQPKTVKRLSVVQPRLYFNYVNLNVVVFVTQIRKYFVHGRGISEARESSVAIVDGIS